MSQSNNSVPKLSPQELAVIKKNILKKRKALVEEFKLKHARIYNWLVEHNIDVNDLGKYTRNAAAALAIANQLIITNPQIAPMPVPPPQVKEKLSDNGSNNNNDEIPLDNDLKAKRVWEKYGDIIDTVSKKYDIDPQLIFATIMTESEGNPQAYRYEAHIDDASYGLGQILYGTAVGLGYNGSPNEMYRPEISIDLIGKYHKNTVDTYGSLAPERMTVVYNTGKLFGWPYPGHLSRFKEWYYNYPKTAFSTLAKSG